MAFTVAQGLLLIVATASMSTVGMANRGFTVQGLLALKIFIYAVFKYDPPSSNVFPHSVYLLPNLWSYLTCDLSRAKIIANSTQGGGDGFKFVLKRWQPYYFACGERGGLHCRDGSMKFMVMPLLRRWHY
ncbi:hypothetical protein Patl1_36195 [Pistacia atlantica]|nr:hypothetical protein Patl1_36195 [Pistacia atlantica]